MYTLIYLTTTPMTLFGKFVFTVLGIVLAFGVFYGVTSFVKDDSKKVAVEEQAPVIETVDSTASSTDTTSTSTVDTNKKPFYELLGTIGDRTCTINQMMGTVSSVGTVYMHEGLVRAEFSTSIANNTIKSTMIARDGYMYSWTDTASSTGTKSKMPTRGADGKVVTNSAVKTWDGSQVKDYTCRDGKVDEALFEIPKQITFATQ